MSGETLRFDLDDPADARRWLEHARLHAFQKEITGLSLERFGTRFDFPRPQSFDGEITLFAEKLGINGRAKGGEQIICCAGDVGVTLMVHAGQRAARINLVRQGKQRFNALERLKYDNGSLTEGRKNSD